MGKCRHCGKDDMSGYGVCNDCAEACGEKLGTPAQEGFDMPENIHLDPEEVEMILQAFEVLGTGAWAAYCKQYEIATGEEVNQDHMYNLEQKLRKLVS